MQGVDLAQTLYVQPRVDDPGDLRVLDETTLVVKPNERLSVGVGFVLTHDARPPAGVSRLDTQLRTTVGLRF